ncbi:hypothetical protein SMI01S_11730 [Sphingobacterium mizutaii NBRC 14946 = DSM 11724]|uniref:Uncharacterized protein n=2 Tax=Sphingobacterium mizutaii TaxID=1010 RepID=A0AAJ4XCL9_9SPHI|nr:hypothetical protein [Sphingobacterium mizutaii]GEM67567.1 hypothetical protein SMI01S_11730 [Sphingobacterium mizutaii NBRC 14946 = DSM 11724]SDL14362.1 hypothetical protein SAMN05192578_1011507 [Sphingobacterium mizutaii]SNV52123.1 Uncharacterised protein [Sphingobacterium mizutaii]
MINIFYVQNPQILKPATWKALVEILNINTVIDFLIYNDPNYDYSSALTAHNEVFNKVPRKYSAHKYIPNDFHALETTEKAKIITQKKNYFLSKIFDNAKEYKGPMSPDRKKVNIQNSNNYLIIYHWNKNLDQMMRYIHFGIKNQSICNPRFIAQSDLRLDLKSIDQYQGNWTPVSIKNVLNELEEKYNLSYNQIFKEEYLEAVQNKYQEHLDRLKYEMDEYNIQARINQSNQDIEDNLNEGRNEVQSWREDFGSMDFDD